MVQANHSDYCFVFDVFFVLCSVYICVIFSNIPLVNLEISSRTRNLTCPLVLATQQSSPALTESALICLRGDSADNDDMIVLVTAKQTTSSKRLKKVRQLE